MFIPRELERHDVARLIAANMPFVLAKRSLHLPESGLSVTRALETPVLLEIFSAPAQLFVIGYLLKRWAATGSTPSRSISRWRTIRTTAFRSHSKASKGVFMVKDLDVFKRHFAEYADCYILIGGSACDVNFSVAAIPFRVMHDLDIVLCVEALRPEIFNRFWPFIRDGEYEHREKSDGERHFYRFTHPTQPGYPEMLELFARKAIYCLKELRDI